MAETPVDWAALAELAKKGVTPDQVRGLATGTNVAFNDDQIRRQAQDRFPGMVWMLDIPQVGDLLRQLIQGDIDAETYKGRLMSTDYWKTHSPAVRAWDTKVASDPAAANAERRARLAQVSDLWRSMGADPGDIDLLAVTENALRFGWSDAELQDAITQQVDLKHPRAGAQGALSTVEQLEHEYAFPLSGESRRRLARQMLGGSMDENTLRAEFIRYAKSAYAGNDDLVEAIESGQTVRDYATPYIEMAARELELSPNQINLLDGKWHRALQTVNKDGRRVPMSLADWQADLRTKDVYGWEYTRAASEMLSGPIFGGS